MNSLRLERLFWLVALSLDIGSLALRRSCPSRLLALAFRTTVRLVLLQTVAPLAVSRMVTEVVTAAWPALAPLGSLVARPPKFVDHFSCTLAMAPPEDCPSPLGRVQTVEVASLRQPANTCRLPSP